MHRYEATLSHPHWRGLSTYVLYIRLFTYARIEEKYIIHANNSTALFSWILFGQSLTKRSPHIWWGTVMLEYIYLFILLLCVSHRFSVCVHKYLLWLLAICSCSQFAPRESWNDSQKNADSMSAPFIVHELAYYNVSCECVCMCVVCACIGRVYYNFISMYSFPIHSIQTHFIKLQLFEIQRARAPLCMYFNSHMCASVIIRCIFHEPFDLPHFFAIFFACTAHTICTHCVLSQVH